MICSSWTRTRAPRPQWWRIVLLPSWIGHTLEFFGLVMLVAFPLSIATDDAVGRWTIYAVVLVLALAYGRYAAHRIQRTVVVSDEASYTVRLEWLRRGTDRRSAAGSR